MSDFTVNHFEVDEEPGELTGSFWHKLAFMRLNIVGDLAAQAVASQSGEAAPSALPGSRIVIREIASGNEVWHVNPSDVTGGTTPDQLRNSIEADLSALSVRAFVAKWGLTQ
jgi:hypothetical protein